VLTPLLSADEMRAWERSAMDAWGISALVLQEHAALGALNLIPEDVQVHVLAGPGNNGGDALALARLLRLRKQPVEVWVMQPDQKWRGIANIQARLWEGMGGRYRFTKTPEKVVPSLRGWVVDGLFGLGAKRALEGIAINWAKALLDAAFVGDGSPLRPFARKPSASLEILALDLPSGLDPSSGNETQATNDQLPGSIRATRTVVFGGLKICHGLRPAKDSCGEITVIPMPFLGEPTSALKRMAGLSTKRPAWFSHKGHFGHVGIRAGSKGMSGAAVLAALGALRAGAGLVTVLTDPDIRAEVAAQVPEAMVRAWDGYIPDGIEVLLVGPGGVAEIPEWNGRLVLDASALHEGEGARWLKRPFTILTPHPGEFSKLFKLMLPHDLDVAGRLQQLREIEKGEALLIYKGAQTLIAGGGQDEIWVNDSGHNGLATGGTGDFLAGMVAGFWAQERMAVSDRLFAEQKVAPAPEILRNNVTFEQGAMRRAAASAVWLHGAAADRLGSGPLLPRDLAQAVPELLRELSK
jgi:ADP-dependent NAD(P)H-hydrate dehydratase / NAD(P)H-hydrate epimerase